MADFEIEFNVDGDASGYDTFIGNLRRQARDGSRTSQQVPVLPPRPASGSRLQVFDVILRTGTHALRLRLQRYNLYILGFRPEPLQAEPLQRWYEFRNEGGQHLIQVENHNDIAWLPWDSQYVHLERDAAHRSLISLGLEQLRNAVNYLAGHPFGNELTGDERAQVARSMIIIVQMICEAARARPIADAVHHNYADLTHPPFPPSVLNLTLQTSWGRISEAVQRHDRNNSVSIALGNGEYFGPEVHNRLEAAEQYGILRGLDWPSEVALALELPDVDMETTAGEAVGRILVQILSMRVVNVDGEDPGHLFGTVKIIDGLHSYYIYNLDIDKAEKISRGKYAALTGPPQAISAADNFIIETDLWERDTWSPNDQVSRGEITWNAYDYTSVYDKEQSHEIKGKYGSVALNYIVMSNAVEATISIILINADNEDPAAIFGTITAMDTDFRREIDLFRKPEPEDRVVQYPSASIPLLRNVLAMPIAAELSIKASLKEWDRWSSNDEIANDEVIFKPELFASSPPQYIKGKYGAIEVRVEWS